MQWACADLPLSRVASIFVVCLTGYVSSCLSSDPHKEGAESDDGNVNVVDLFVVTPWLEVEGRTRF